MAEKLYYTMGELAEMFDVNTSLIRYWETQFGVLRPKRNKKGNRMFTTADVERLKLIYHLVRERGMTLEGAKKALRQQRGETPGVDREVELMERLQHIRSLLLEVREDLKDGDGESLEIKVDSSSESATHQSDMPVKVCQKAQRAPKAKVVAEVAKEPELEKAVEQESEAPECIDNTPVGQQFADSFDQPIDLQDDQLEDMSDVEFEADFQPTTDEESKIENENSSKDGSDIDSQTNSTSPSNNVVVVRRPRRRKEDAENKELFAFYEQSLF